MTFTGIPEEAFAFYERLEADNSKAFWQEHKATYEECVRDPMTALLEALEPEFGAGQLFRPYRDVRFSTDKSPYKTHQGGFVQRVAGVGFYLQVSADGLLVAGGFHSHTPVQVERYRAAVDAPASGARLAGIVAELRSAGLGIEGERLKTRPRGFPADHPRIELLRHRSLTAGRAWPPEPWVHKPEALERIRETWHALVPLCDWIRVHVGPPDQVSPRPGTRRSAGV